MVSSETSHRQSSKRRSMLNTVRQKPWQKTQLWGLYKTQDGSLSDRIEIEKLLDSGHSQTMIAAQLGCHRSTISRVSGAGPGRLNETMRTCDHICATNSTPGCHGSESISPGKPNTTRRNGKRCLISRIG